ncbi:hypothetical protein HYH03_014538 [Edaphochlamys debaryana]|uniref:Protein kinase domain-containing protein n=1 Tax=Edaphochlamys debaryana TaxID=47281 RepID=A0A835XNR2_9CHLO|nr:hypothetical protein HYH03_014538 [Edaphochlamys debaryana]|eukprot:KAG2486855.1 hypothetical protein HYH03_014538 [Edaphochlamys debaryana]
MFLGSWSARLSSIVEDERASASWIGRLHGPPSQVPDNEGRPMVTFTATGTGCWIGFNSTISAVPLLTPTYDSEFGLGAPGLRPAPTGTGPVLVPPTAVATAATAPQLLDLIQAPPPDGGTRAVFLLSSITPQRSAWPQAGAALRCHLLLLGPQGGSLGTWLDTSAAAPLVRPAPNATAATGGLQVQFWRLGVRLASLPSPLLATASRLGADAVQSSPALEQWQDSCLAKAEASSRVRVVFRLHECTAQGPPDFVAAVAAFSCPQNACTPAGQAGLGPLAAPACALASAANGSEAAGAGKLPPSLRAMLQATFGVQEEEDGEQQAPVCGPLTGSLESFSVTVAIGTLYGVGLDAVTLSAAADLGDAAGTGDACDAQSLLMGAWRLLAPVEAPAGGGGGGSSGASVGPIVGGVIGAAVGLAALAVLAALWWRRRRAATTREGASASDAKAEGEGQVPDGGPAGQQAEATPRDSSAPSAPAAEDSRSLELLSRLTLGSRSGDMIRAAGPWSPPWPTQPAPASKDDQGPDPTPPTVVSPRAGDGAIAASLLDSHSASVTALAGHIRGMVAKVEASLPRSDTDARPRAPKCLGRGAFGVVFLGSFRSLPAAVKVITFDANNPGGRDKVANEVALSMALKHPCVVPTYGFELTALIVDERGVETELPEGPRASEADALEDAATTGRRLRIYMQYCEGGNLASALRSGAFRGPSGGTQSPLMRTWSSAATPPPHAHDMSYNAGGASHAQHGGAGPTLLGPSAPLPAVAESADCDVVVPEAHLGRPPLEPQPQPAAAQFQPEPEPQAQPGQGGPRAAAIGGGAGMGSSALGGGSRAAATLEPQLEPAFGEGPGPLRMASPPPVAAGPEPDAASSNAAVSAVAPEAQVAAELPAGSVSVQLAAAGMLPAAGGSTGSSRRGSQDNSGPLGRGGGGAPRTAGALPYAQRHRPVSLPSRQLVGEAPRVGNLPLALLAAWDVARGLEYCHAAGVVHGDINDNNVLLKMASPALGGVNTPFGLLSSEGSTGSAPLALAAFAGAAASHAAAPPSAVAARASRRGLTMTAAGMLGGGGGGMDMAGSGRDLALSTFEASRTADNDCDSCASEAGAPAWSAMRQGSLSPMDAAEHAAAANAARRWAALEAAVGMLGTVYKIADLGLAVQLAGATHISNLAQGTPFFAAPEVVLSGHLSPAADIYSFGVLLWLLLHGTSMAQIRPMLPRIQVLSAAPTLLARAAPELPEPARRLLADCLAEEPAERPSAVALRQRVRALMQEVAGPELAQLLLGTERKEVVVAETGL